MEPSLQADVIRGIIYNGHPDHTTPRETVQYIAAINVDNTADLFCHGPGSRVAEFPKLWIVLDSMMPIVMRAGGCRLWRKPALRNHLGHSLT